MQYGEEKLGNPGTYRARIGGWGDEGYPGGFTTENREMLPPFDRPGEARFPGSRWRPGAEKIFTGRY